MKNLKNGPWLIANFLKIYGKSSNNNPLNNAANNNQANVAAAKKGNELYVQQIHEMSVALREKEEEIELMRNSLKELEKQLNNPTNNNINNSNNISIDTSVNESLTTEQQSALTAYTPKQIDLPFDFIGSILTAGLSASIALYHARTNELISSANALKRNNVHENYINELRNKLHEQNELLTAQDALLQYSIFNNNNDLSNNNEMKQCRRLSDDGELQYEQNKLQVEKRAFYKERALFQEEKSKLNANQLKLFSHSKLTATNINSNSNVNIGNKENLSDNIPISCITPLQSKLSQLSPTPQLTPLTSFQSQFSSLSPLIQPNFGGKSNELQTVQEVPEINSPQTN